MSSIPYHCISENLQDRLIKYLTNNPNKTLDEIKAHFPEYRPATITNNVRDLAMNQQKVMIQKGCLARDPQKTVDLYAINTMDDELDEYFDY